MVTTSQTSPRTRLSKTAKPIARVEAKDSAKPKPMVNLIHANAIALNFAIEAKKLRDNIPAGLQLDHYKGDAYVSLVCMEIRKLPLLGLPIIPRFCELSLRCFVSQRNRPENRGVLYLKSYASSKLGAWALGNLVPHPYQFLPIKANNTGFGTQGAPEIDYQWKIEGHENRLRIRARDKISKRGPGTKLGFILDHATRFQSDHGKTIGYEISRPTWVLWDAAQANFTCDVRRLFGTQFVKPLAARPVSVFVAAGSKVKLHRPKEI